MSKPEYNCDGPWGKVVGESDHHYHSLNAISKSKLCDFTRITGGNPAFFHQKHVLKTVPKEDTPALRFGQLFHFTMRFGARVLDLTYPAHPDFGDCRNRENKANRDQWRLEHPQWEGSPSAEERSVLHAMFNSAMGNRHVRDLIEREGGEYEVSWRAKPTTLPFAVQCRTDYINLGGCTLSQRKPYIVDFKSVRSLSHGDIIRNWEQSYFDYGYFVQDPYYLDVLGLCGAPIDDMEFYFVAVEKEPPYACAIFTSDEIGRGLGRKTIREGLSDMARCFESNLWPAYEGEGIHTCTVPEWRVKNAYRQS